MLLNLCEILKTRMTAHYLVIGGDFNLNITKFEQNVLPNFLIDGRNKFQVRDFINNPRTEKGRRIDYLVCDCSITIHNVHRYELKPINNLSYYLDHDPVVAELKISSHAKIPRPAGEQSTSNELEENKPCQQFHLDYGFLTMQITSKDDANKHQQTKLLIAKIQNLYEEMTGRQSGTSPEKYCPEGEAGHCSKAQSKTVNGNPLSFSMSMKDDCSQVHEIDRELDRQDSQEEVDELILISSDDDADNEEEEEEKEEVGNGEMDIDAEQEKRFPCNGQGNEDFMDETVQWTSRQSYLNVRPVEKVFQHQTQSNRLKNKQVSPLTKKTFRGTIKHKQI